MLYEVILSEVQYDDEVDGNTVCTAHLPIDITYLIEAEDEDEAEDVALDLLTDLTGFCVIDVLSTVKKVDDE